MLLLSKANRTNFVSLIEKKILELNACRINPFVPFYILIVKILISFEQKHIDEIMLLLEACIDKKQALNDPFLG